MNKKSRIIPFSILTMLLVIGSGVLSSCSTPTTSETPTTITSTPVVEVSKVTLSETKVSLEETATKQLTATVLPDTATVKTVVWSSSDSKIATVSDAGLVTAIKAGTATISAKAGSKTATCEVTVTAKIIAVASIALDHTTVSVEAGKTAALVATVLPE
ncbi:MAG: Ig-like domain-containing protein, partial [Bacilli bacterium]